MAERIAVFTPPFRVSFPSLFRPSSFNGGEPKFSVAMLFYPKLFNEQAKKAWADMIRIADEAGLEKFKKRVKEFPDNMRKPFRKGEEKVHLDGYGEGCVFAAASSKQAPGVVDRNREALLEQDLYAGCWARASVTAYAYDNKGKGVSFGLHNVQKLAEGESFSGRIAAEEDFGDEVDNIFPDTSDKAMATADDDTPF